jgi:hypothetical protein
MKFGKKFYPRPCEAVARLIEGPVMQAKKPVTLNDSDVEIAGTELSDFDTFRFWSDTFRHMDLLRYQQNESVQYMITEVPETTTYEIEIVAENLPAVIEQAWETGKRFAIHVENEYFDLDVNTARVADYSEGSATIVAEIDWQPLACA